MARYRGRARKNQPNTLMWGLGLAVVAGGVWYLWRQQQAGKEAVAALSADAEPAALPDWSASADIASADIVSDDAGLPASQTRRMTPENQAIAREAARTARGRGSSGEYSRFGMKFGKVSTLVSLTDAVTGDIWKIRVYKDGTPAQFVTQVPATAAA